MSAQGGRLRHRRQCGAEHMLTEQYVRPQDTVQISFTGAVRDETRSEHQKPGGQESNNTTTLRALLRSPFAPAPQSKPATRVYAVCQDHQRRRINVWTPCSEVGAANTAICGSNVKDLPAGSAHIAAGTRCTGEHETTRSHGNPVKGSVEPKQNLATIPAFAMERRTSPQQPRTQASVALRQVDPAMTRTSVLPTLLPFAGWLLPRRLKVPEGRTPKANLWPLMTSSALRCASTYELHNAGHARAPVRNMSRRGVGPCLRLSADDWP